MFSGFDTMFSLFAGFVGLFIVAVVGVIVYQVIRAASQRRQDSVAPEVTAIARVADKRIQVSGGDDFPIREEHFVTFEQPTGERFELQVPATDYGLLVNGDQGTVSMKGSRFLGFSRELMR